MRSFSSMDAPPRRGHFPAWLVPPFCARSIIGDSSRVNDS